MRALGVRPSLQHYTSLIHAAGIVGAPPLIPLFLSLPFLLVAQVSLGDHFMAKTTMDSLIAAGLNPDRITFTAYLTAFLNCIRSPATYCSSPLPRTL